MAAPPSEIDWSVLSLRSREIILHVTTRLAAGYEYSEVAERLDRERPDVRHLELPPPTKRITKAWFQDRCRELRKEIEERRATSY